MARKNKKKSDTSKKDDKTEEMEMKKDESVEKKEETSKEVTSPKTDAKVEAKPIEDTPPPKPQSEAMPQIETNAKSVHVANVEPDETPEGEIGKAPKEELSSAGSLGYSVPKLETVERAPCKFEYEYKFEKHYYLKKYTGPKFKLINVANELASPEQAGYYHSIWNLVTELFKEYWKGVIMSEEVETFEFTQLKITKSMDRFAKAKLEAPDQLIDRFQQLLNNCNCTRSYITNNVVVDVDPYTRLSMEMSDYYKQHFVFHRKVLAAFLSQLKFIDAATSPNPLMSKERDWLSLKLPDNRFHMFMDIYSVTREFSRNWVLDNIRKLVTQQSFITVETFKQMLENIGSNVTRITQPNSAVTLISSKMNVSDTIETYHNFISVWCTSRYFMLSLPMFHDYSKISLVSIMEAIAIKTMVPMVALSNETVNGVCNTLYFGIIEPAIRKTGFAPTFQFTNLKQFWTTENFLASWFANGGNEVQQVRNRYGPGFVLFLNVGTPQNPGYGFGNDGGLDVLGQLIPGSVVTSDMNAHMNINLLNSYSAPVPPFSPNFGTASGAGGEFADPVYAVPEPDNGMQYLYQSWSGQEIFNRPAGLRTAMFARMSDFINQIASVGLRDNFIMQCTSTDIVTLGKMLTILPRREESLMLLISNTDIVLYNLAQAQLFAQATDNNMLYYDNGIVGQGRRVRVGHVTPQVPDLRPIGIRRGTVVGNFTLLAQGDAVLDSNMIPPTGRPIIRQAVVMDTPVFIQFMLGLEFNEPNAGLKPEKLHAVMDGLTIASDFNMALDIISARAQIFPRTILSTKKLIEASLPDIPQGIARKMLEKVVETERSVNVWIPTPAVPFKSRFVLPFIRTVARNLWMHDMTVAPVRGYNHAVNLLDRRPAGLALYNASTPIPNVLGLGFDKVFAIGNRVSGAGGPNNTINGATIRWLSQLGDYKLNMILPTTVEEEPSDFDYEVIEGSRQGTFTIKPVKYLIRYDEQTNYSDKVNYRSEKRYLWTPRDADVPIRIVFKLQTDNNDPRRAIYSDLADLFRYTSFVEAKSDDNYGVGIRLIHQDTITYHGYNTVNVV